MSELDQQETNSLVEHFFRHEYANRVSILSRVFGLQYLDLVEDMVSAAMVEAMHVWKHRGVPENPAAWIHRVAKNRILDALRREQVHQRALAFSGILDHLNRGTDSRCDPANQGWLDESSIDDSLLRMMFVCCHPLLDRKTQVALTLKILCGFSFQEIARGLLMTFDAVKKRVQRGKQLLSESQVSMELPDRSELEKRLSVVHEVLYLMFNEGYSATQGVVAIRDDVCEEAARLCHMLCQNDELSSPSSFALLSLMLLHASRMPARTDADGKPVLLADQDRSRWDRKLIATADFWLVRSAQSPPSRYHLEAAIAKMHCSASSLNATDWTSIVKLYDRLLEMVDSPVYRLNRAIAIGQNGNHPQALSELDALCETGRLKDYFLLECARGHVFELQGDRQAAIDCYSNVLSLELAEHQRMILREKLDLLASPEFVEDRET